VRARIDGQGPWRDGVANFGRTPTTGLRDPLLETFLLDWEGDLYGRMLEVALVEFLRPELNFASVDEMVARMHVDVENARAELATNPANGDSLTS